MNAADYKLAAARARIEWERRHPIEMQKEQARALTQKAIRSGILKRPSTCPECNTAKFQIHAHHEDYSKPLEILWLCASCHTTLHAKRRAAAKRVPA